ncbi:hypothetical protein RB195_014703 [Necator americanus]|uniref:Uncharacterized protein n=1 Tax=Necator americanus TaxID=51031 RepID=A0ABR1E1D7_NECAM
MKIEWIHISDEGAHIQGQTDVSSQWFYLLRQVWYQLIDPGGMSGLVTTGADSNLRSIVQAAEPLTDCTTPPTPCHNTYCRKSTNNFSSLNSTPAFYKCYLCIKAIRNE